MTTGEPVVVNIGDMIDLALGTPEVGYVDFNMLHAVLHIIVQQVGIVQKSVQLNGPAGAGFVTAPANKENVVTVAIKEFAVDTPDGAPGEAQTLIVLDRVRKSDAAPLPHTRDESPETRKGSRTGTAKGAGATGAGGAGGIASKLGKPAKSKREDISDGTLSASVEDDEGEAGKGKGAKVKSKKEKKPKTGKGGVLDSPSSASETRSPASMDRLSLVTMSKFNILEGVVNDLRLTVFGAIPKNEELIGEVRSQTNLKAITDMWQNINVVTRLTAAETGIGKLSSIVEDVIGECNVMKTTIGDLGKATGVSVPPGPFGAGINIAAVTEGVGPGRAVPGPIQGGPGGAGFVQGGPGGGFVQGGPGGGGFVQGGPAGGGFVQGGPAGGFVQGGPAGGGFVQGGPAGGGFVQGGPAGGFVQGGPAGGFVQGGPAGGGFVQGGPAGGFVQGGPAGGGFVQGGPAGGGFNQGGPAGGGFVQGGPAGGGFVQGGPEGGFVQGGPPGGGFVQGGPGGGGVMQGGPAGGGFVQGGPGGGGFVQGGPAGGGFIQGGPAGGGFVQGGPEGGGLVQGGPAGGGFVQGGPGGGGFVQGGPAGGGFVQGGPAGGFVQGGPDGGGFVQGGPAGGFVQGGPGGGGFVQGGPEGGLVQGGPPGGGFVQGGPGGGGFVQGGPEGGGFVQGGPAGGGFVQGGPAGGGFVQGGPAGGGFVQGGPGGGGFVQGGPAGGGFVQGGPESGGFVQGGPEGGFVQGGPPGGGFVQGGPGGGGFVQGGPAGGGFVQGGPDGGGFVQGGPAGGGFVQGGPGGGGFAQPGAAGGGFVQGGPAGGAVQGGPGGGGFVQGGPAGGTVQGGPGGFVQGGPAGGGVQGGPAGAVVQGGPGGGGFVQGGPGGGGFVQGGPSGGGMVQGGPGGFVQGGPGGAVQGGPGGGGFVQGGPGGGGFVQGGPAGGGFVQPGGGAVQGVPGGFAQAGPGAVAFGGGAEAAGPGAPISGGLIQGGGYGSAAPAVPFTEFNLAELENYATRKELYEVQKVLNQLVLDLNMLARNFYSAMEGDGEEEEAGLYEDRDTGPGHKAITGPEDRGQPAEYRSATSGSSPRERDSRADTSSRGSQGSGVEHKVHTEIDKAPAKDKKKKAAGGLRPTGMTGLGPGRINQVYERLDDLDRRIKECCASRARTEGLLDDKIANLQDQVMGLLKQAMTAPQGARGRVPSLSQDVVTDLKGLSQLFETVREMQEQFNQVHETALQLASEKEVRQYHMNAILEQIEMLKAIKMDREDMVEAMADKADVRMLARKVSYDQFELACDDLSKGLEHALGKLGMQEALWQQALDDVQREIETKLDKVELSPVKEFFNNKLRQLQDHLKQMATLRREAEAAGTKRKLIRDVNCISCDAKAVMQADASATLPVSRPLPANLSMKPYLSYELDAIRKTQASSMQQRNMHDWEAIDKIDKKQARKVRSETDKHLCNRYCGGSHTVTTPAQRVARLGHFIKQWGPDVLPMSSGLAAGDDGKLYKVAVGEKAEKPDAEQPPPEPCTPKQAPKKESLPRTPSRPPIVITNECRCLDPHPERDRQPK